MLNIKTIAIISSLVFAASAVANAPQRSLTPVFVEGSQYSAVLDQSAGQWRLLSQDGIDLNVSASGTACDEDAKLPEGIWLLTRAEDGAPTLTAPSATALPAGYPEEVAMVACGTAITDSAPHVSAPQGLIDWLSYNSGSIYVTN